MTERRAFADWRFLAMLVVLLLTGYLILMGVEQARIKDRQIAALTDAAVTAEANATRQRLDLIETQRDLLARLTSYDARQRRLLAYLRAHGIEIPTRYIILPRATPPPRPAPIIVVPAPGHIPPGTKGPKGPPPGKGNPH